MCVKERVGGGGSVGGGKKGLLNVGSGRNPETFFPAEVGCWVDSRGGWVAGMRGWSETFLAVENYSFILPELFFLWREGRRDALPSGTPSSPKQTNKPKRWRVLGPPNWVPMLKQRIDERTTNRVFRVSVFAVLSEKLPLLTPSSCLVNF